MDGATITSLVTLATIVIGFMVQIYRENRNRRWDLADRAELAAKVEDNRYILAAKMEDNRHHVAATANELKTLIHENTQISTNAFHEANTVNIKLEKLGLEHIVQSVKQTEAVDKLTDALNKEKRE